MTTGPDDDFGKREAPGAVTVTGDAMYAAPRTALSRPQGCVPPRTALVADRAVDLLRVSSALCTAPGAIRGCRG